MELRSSPTRSRSQILRQSLYGVKQWLLDEWSARVVSPSLTVVLASTLQGERLVDLFTGVGDGAALKMPYAVLVPTQFSPSSDRFNAFALQKIGMRTGLVNGDRQERREKIKPIEVGLGVKFMTNDINEAMMLAQIWQENSPDACIQVTQRNTGFVFNITLVPDPSVDIPSQSDSEKGDLPVNTTLIVKTFTGTTELNKVITKRRFDILQGRAARDYNDENDEGVLIHRLDRNGFKVQDPQRLQNLELDP